MKRILFFIFSYFTFLLIHGQQSDTLTVGYTYWWSESGPFIGLCGEPYALVFKGHIKSIKETPIHTNTYTSQKGSISIEEVLYSTTLAKQKYQGEKVFVSDCFYGSHLNEADAVLVFCYAYEDAYCIPGAGSILPIHRNDDAIITSVKEYITSGQNPSMLKNDKLIWEPYGLSPKITQMIHCFELTPK